MPTNDQVVSIHPYFKVAPGKMDEFKNLCDQCVTRTASESGCLYYGFSFSDDMAHCREAYEDAEALLHHLKNVDSVLSRMLQISTLDRLEIHAIPQEMAKLTEPLSSLSPTYFTLEKAIRRAHS